MKIQFKYYSCILAALFIGCGQQRSGEAKSLPQASASSFDLPGKMREKIDQYITHSIENRISLLDFEAGLKAKFGLIYNKARIPAGDVDKDLLKDSGWSGEAMYEYSLDAGMACIVFVKSGTIVGGLRETRKPA